MACVDGVSHSLDLHVMRDHTHGSVRDWRLMHRYGIQHFRTTDGFRRVVPRQWRSKGFDTHSLVRTVFTGNLKFPNLLPDYTTRQWD